MGSPSSRRAWIEIMAEVEKAMNVELSPSSRRAWIEIVHTVVFFVSHSRRPPRGGRG